MGVSKVIYYGETLVDMEHVTVTPETLGEGETALDASGELIQGTAKIGGTELPGLTNPGAAADLLRGKQLIDEDGNIVSGTMTNWGNGVNAYLSRTATAYTIPAGYHNGSGKVNVNVATLEVTPTKLGGTYTAPVGGSANPSASKLYGSVKVNPIPDEYQDVSAVTATAEDVASGKVFVDATGAVVTGTAESGGGGEYYTITNNTGLDLVICDHVVTAGTTVDIPVDVDALTEVGGYLLMYTWTGNIITPTKSYIVATVNGSVPVQSPKNRINRLTFYVGPTMACTVFMAGVDIATAGTTLTAPASGSTIVLTLSS